MSDYYRKDRRDRDGRHSVNQFRERRRHGWGMGLYRNRRDGKICGVAAGLADYWDVADWVVRLMFIGAFLFTGTLAIWAYLAGFFLLSPRPEEQRRRGRKQRRKHHDAAPESFREPAPSASRRASRSANEEAFGPEMEYDERYQDYRPRRMFRYSESASVRLAKARERLDAAVSRVEDMETYVTSRRFKLNREFSRL